MLAFSLLRFLLLCLSLLVCFGLSRLCSVCRPPPALCFDLIRGAQAEGGKGRRGKCANTRANNPATGCISAHGSDEVIESIAFHWAPHDTAVQAD
jgi:hypothetical protein